MCNFFAQHEVAQIGYLLGYTETQSIYKSIIFKFLNIERGVKSLTGNIPSS